MHVYGERPGVPHRRSVKRELGGRLRHRRMLVASASAIQAGLHTHLSCPSAIPSGGLATSVRLGPIARQHDSTAVQHIAAVRSSHVARIRDGAFRTVDDPSAVVTAFPFEFGPGLGTAGFGINDPGVVVGQYSDAAGVGHGFIARGGNFTTYDAPGAAPQPGIGSGGTELLRINDRFDTAGNFDDGNPDPSVGFHGFIISNGNFTSLNVPGSTFTQVLGLSNSGVASGFINTDSAFLLGKGFLWKAGHYTLVGGPRPDRRGSPQSRPSIARATSQANTSSARSSTATSACLSGEAPSWSARTLTASRCTRRSSTPRVCCVSARGACNIGPAAGSAGAAGWVGGLGLMAQGKSNLAIADQLVLSPRTIESHVGSVFDKLGLNNTPDDHRRVLAVLAYLKA
jgi:hypothetical protein